MRGQKNVQHLAILEDTFLGSHNAHLVKAFSSFSRHLLYTTLRLFRSVVTVLRAEVRRQRDKASLQAVCPENAQLKCSHTICGLSQTNHSVSDNGPGCVYAVGPRCKRGEARGWFVLPASGAEAAFDQQAALCGRFVWDGNTPSMRACRLSCRSGPL